MLYYRISFERAFKILLLPNFSVLDGKFNPRNTHRMSAVKFSILLELK